MNNKPAKTFYVAGFSSDPTRTTTEELAIDEAGELAVWFQVTNVHGWEHHRALAHRRRAREQVTSRRDCSAWDSNLGSNYTFEIAR